MYLNINVKVKAVFCSAASALTYYGICMNISSFGVGVYSAQFFSGLSEAPCLLVPLVRLGRRPISMLALFLSGASCFLSLLLSRYNGEDQKEQRGVERTMYRRVSSAYSQYSGNR